MDPFSLQKSLNIFVKIRVLSHVLSWLTLGLIYEMSREDPEIRSVMGWNESRGLSGIVLVSD